MLNVQNLSFAYSKDTVLRHVSFSVSEGEFVAIVGPNGSGKSTLLRLLCGQLTPTSGILSGAPYGKKEKQALSKTIAYFPQGRPTPNLTAEELVACGRFPYTGLSGKLTEEDQHVIENAMARTETVKFRERRVGELSYGERQRVYLAMLFAQNTPYLLLDEPTAYTDISKREDILRMLKRETKDGKGVIAVLHELDLALRYADRILVVSKGVLVADLSASELVSSGKLTDVFDVEIHPVQVNDRIEYILRKAYL